MGCFTPGTQTLDCQTDAEITYSLLLHLLQAAQELHKLGPKYVLIKGGHLITPPPSDPTTTSSPPSAPPTSTPLPSHPATPSPSAAAAASSSAPQSSPEDASDNQDSAAQSSETAPTTSSADVSHAANASTSETQGPGGSAATNGHGDVGSDSLSAAGEGTTRQREGMQAKPIKSGYISSRDLEFRSVLTAICTSPCPPSLLGQIPNVVTGPSKAKCCVTPSNTQSQIVVLVKDEASSLLYLVDFVPFLGCCGPS